MARATNNAIANHPPQIVVILGDSTSGKTTLLNALRKKRLGRLSIHDMDENGCPTAGREDWRRYRVHELLSNGVAEYQRGVSSVIGGWIWPHEIIESPHYDCHLNLQFVYLWTSERDYRRRLRQRIGNEITAEDFRLWSAGFKERHRKLNNQVQSLRQATLINTGQTSVPEVVFILQRLLRPPRG